MVVVVVVVVAVAEIQAKLKFRTEARAAGELSPPTTLAADARKLCKWLRASRNLRRRASPGKAARVRFATLGHSCNLDAAAAFGKHQIRHRGYPEWRPQQRAANSLRRRRRAQVRLEITSAGRNAHAAEVAFCCGRLIVN